MKTKPKYALIKYSGSMVATMAISQWVMWTEKCAGKF